MKKASGGSASAQEVAKMQVELANERSEKKLLLTRVRSILSRQYVV